MNEVDLLVGLVILVGLAGIVVPLLPGSMLILGAVLVWTVMDGSRTAWTVFAVATVRTAMDRGARLGLGLTAGSLLAVVVILFTLFERHGGHFSTFFIHRCFVKRLFCRLVEKHKSNNTDNSCYTKRYFFHISDYTPVALETSTESSGR